MENIQKNQTKKITPEEYYNAGYNKACNGYIPDTGFYYYQKRKLTPAMALNP